MRRIDYSDLESAESFKFGFPFLGAALLAIGPICGSALILV
jgi:hypothetical protein